MRLRFVLAALGIMLAAGAAQAQSVEEFYRKTQLSVYVGSGAGGGFDEIARVFAQHFVKHIPGNPTPIVKNMPGAGGLLNVNFMYQQAPRDGSAIAAPFNTVFMLPVFGDPAVKFDSREFTWIGSLDKQTATCMVWHTSKIMTIEDAKKSDVQVSATGVNATPAIFPSMLNAFLKTRFKVISGYSTTEMRLALERGEVEGICGLAWQTLKAVVPGWIAEKKIRPLLQMGLVPHPELQGVPLAVDLITDPVERQIFELVVLPQEFGRPFMAPPGVPKDRAEALQRAFELTLKDPAFLADAAKIRLSLDPLRGGEILALLEKAYKAPKDVVTRAAKFTAGQ